MARNPKPVRRRYKRAQAQIRRGEYQYRPPSYDDLNVMKPAFPRYAVERIWVNVGRSLNRAAAALSGEMGGAAKRLRQAFQPRSYHYQDDFRLIE